MSDWSNNRVVIRRKHPPDETAATFSFRIQLNASSLFIR